MGLPMRDFRIVVYELVDALGLVMNHFFVLLD